MQYAYSRTSLDDSTGTILPAPGSAATAINQIGYNFLYYLNTTNEGAKIRPFFTGGFHFSDYVLPFAALTHGNDFKPGFNYGMGIKYRISTLFGLRFDIRGYDTGKPEWSYTLYQHGGILHQTEASVGFGWYF